MKDLWSKGLSNHKGEFFQMDNCMMKPAPSGDIKLVVAGQSDRGMEFASNLADFNFVNGLGVNTPTACQPTVQRLVEASAATGRDVGSYMLFMVIAEETDEAAQAKWQRYRDGADVDALTWMADQGGKDQAAGASSTARHINLPEGAVNFNMGTIVGSYAAAAALLDEVAAMPGAKGIMLTFDDFIEGIDKFGEHVQPLMTCRKDRAPAAA
jgi:pyrimidine oxygenase